MPNVIKIRGNKLCIYYKSDAIKSDETKDQLFQEEKPEKKDTTPSGFMNIRIKKAIEKIIINWMNAGKNNYYLKELTYKFCPVFITLTLPAGQEHSDQELHRKALGKFIIYMQRQGYFANYLWRAERQQNGNIHYHILTDKFINYKLIRSTWNTVLESLQYVTQFKFNRHNEYLQRVTGVSNTYFETLNFNDKLSEVPALNKMYEDPNSTDIHKLRSINNVAKYVCKYMSKSEYYVQKAEIKKELETGLIDKVTFDIKHKEILQSLSAERIQGRVWGCSDSVKKMQDIEVLQCDEMAQVLSNLNDDDSTSIFTNEYVTIVSNPALDKFLSVSKYYRRTKNAVDRENIKNLNFSQHQIKHHDYTT